MAHNLRWRDGRQTRLHKLDPETGLLSKTPRDKWAKTRAAGVISYTQETSLINDKSAIEK